MLTNEAWRHGNKVRRFCSNGIPDSDLFCAIVACVEIRTCLGFLVAFAQTNKVNHVK